MLPVELKEVVSSNLAAYGYTSATQTLYVKFKSGDIWCYIPVPEWVYQEFEEAESKGKFFHARIRNSPLYIAVPIEEEAIEPQNEEKSPCHGT